MWWPLHLFALLAAGLLFAWRLNVNHRYHPLALINKLKRRRFLGKKGPPPQVDKESKAEAEIQ
jgi:lipopolysaccharide export system permease protein